MLIIVGLKFIPLMFSAFEVNWEHSPAELNIQGVVRLGYMVQVEVWKSFIHSITLLCNTTVAVGEILFLN